MIDVLITPDELTNLHSIAHRKAVLQLEEKQPIHHGKFKEWLWILSPLELETHNQLIGILGEFAFAKHYGIPYVHKEFTCIQDCYDDAQDFYLTDVKSTDILVKKPKQNICIRKDRVRNNRFYVISLVHLQDPFKPINEITVSLAGFITGNEINSNSKYQLKENLNLSINSLNFWDYRVYILFEDLQPITNFQPPTKPLIQKGMFV